MGTGYRIVKLEEQVIMGGSSSNTHEAEVPCADERVDLSEMDQLLGTVKWLLDVLSPDNIDVCSVAIASCTKSPDILKGVVSLIYNRAVLEPKNCPLYAKLCSHLHEKLPTFPPEEAGGKEIIFKRILVDKCQSAFERGEETWAEVEQMSALDQDLVKILPLGNIRLIGELLKHNVISEVIVRRVIEKLLETDKEGWPSVQNIEAVWQLLRTNGKQLDEMPISKRAVDSYMNKLNNLAIEIMGVLHLWFMVRSIVLLRANNWEPNPQLVVTKLHSESEENLSDTNNQVDALKRKTVSFLEEYLDDLNLGKALRCIEELDSPSYHSKVVKEAISLCLERSSSPCTDHIVWLLEHLVAKNVMTDTDVADGCILYGSLMDNTGTDLPSAPHGFGEIMGKLVLAGRLDFGAVKQVLETTEYDLFRKAMFNATLWVVSFSPAAQAPVVEAQASEIKACRLCSGLF